jgi:hypothetical protein
MFYTLIKLDGHFYEKNTSARNFNISLYKSWLSLLYLLNKTWLSLLYLLYDADLYHENQVENNKTPLERVLYTDKTGFFSQSERTLSCIPVIIINNYETNH